MLTEAALAFAIMVVPAVEPPPQEPPAGRITIDQAVAEALARNLALQAERSRVPVAEARRVTAALRPNPVLSFSGDHLDLAGTAFNEINGGGPGEFSFRTDYVWEQAGKRRQRIAVAEEERAVARHDVADQARQLVYQVQSAFTDLLLAQETLALVRDSLAALQRVAEVSAVRVRSGDLAEVELMRTRVAVLQLENEMRQRDLVRRTAQQRLHLLMGRQGSAATLDAVGELRRGEEPLPPADDVVQQALGRRPDLEALVADQARSQAELRLQMAMGRLDYTIGAEFRRQQGLAGRNNSVGVFMSAPLPFFDRNQGEVARARSEVDQAARRAAALRAAIASEVREACDQRDTARSLLQRIEHDMLTDAREVRTITEYAYQRGEASLVELLDAQRAFNETVQSHVAAKAEYARSLYLIDAVSGKGDAR